MKIIRLFYKGPKAGKMDIRFVPVKALPIWFVLEYQHRTDFRIVTVQ